MSVQVVGPWVLLGLGVVIVLVQLWLSLGGRSQVRSSVLAFVFGLAFCGTGIFGLPFLSAYGQFLKTAEIFKQVIEAPSPESYGKALKAVAEDRIAPLQQKAILAYMVDRPVSGMDVLLADATKRATKPIARRALEDAGRDYQLRVESTDKLLTALKATNQLTPQTLQTLDRGSRAFVAARLASPHALQPLKQQLGPVQVKSLMQAVER
jgi:hypothetical protein